MAEGTRSWKLPDLPSTPTLCACACMQGVSRLQAFISAWQHRIIPTWCAWSQNLQQLWVFQLQVQMRESSTQSYLQIEFMAHTNSSANQQNWAKVLWWLRMRCCFILARHHQTIPHTCPMHHAAEVVHPSLPMTRVEVHDCWYIACNQTEHLRDSIASAQSKTMSIRVDLIVALCFVVPVFFYVENKWMKWTSLKLVLCWSLGAHTKTWHYTSFHQRDDGNNLASFLTFDMAKSDMQ